MNTRKLPTSVPQHNFFYTDMSDANMSDAKMALIMQCYMMQLIKLLKIPITFSPLPIPITFKNKTILELDWHINSNCSVIDPRSGCNNYD